MMGEAYVFGLCPICEHPMNLCSFVCEDETLYFYAACSNCGYRTSEETSEKELLDQIHSPNINTLKHMLEFCNRNILFFSKVARSIAEVILPNP